jgi:cytochrome b involved in lipid metabolism
MLNLLTSSGKDASEPFDEIGHSQDAIDLLKRFYVGDLDPKVCLSS